MLIRITVLGLAVLVSPLGAQEGPWLGRWRLDRSVSSPGANTGYRRVDLTIREEGGQFMVAYDMVGTRGGRTHLEWAGPLDGQDYPVRGVDRFVTNAYTRTDDRSYTIRVGLDGQPVASTRVSVSEDGATLTAVTMPEGGSASSTSVYRRR